MNVDLLLPLTIGLIGLVTALGLPLARMGRPDASPASGPDQDTARSAATFVEATDPWTEFRRELKRSRRMERPVVLMRFAPTNAPTRAVDVAARLATELRDVDRIWVEGEEILILLPETTAAQAASLAGRLQRAAGPLLRQRRLSWATFPDDAVTGEALLRIVRRRGDAGDRAATGSPGPGRPTSGIRRLRTVMADAVVAARPSSPEGDGPLETANSSENGPGLREGSL